MPDNLQVSDLTGWVGFQRQRFEQRFQDAANGGYVTWWAVVDAALRIAGAYAGILLAVGLILSKAFAAPRLEVRSAKVENQRKLPTKGVVGTTYIRKAGQENHPIPKISKEMLAADLVLEIKNAGSRRVKDVYATADPVGSFEGTIVVAPDQFPRSLAAHESELFRININGIPGGRDKLGDVRYEFEVIAVGHRGRPAAARIGLAMNDNEISEPTTRQRRLTWVTTARTRLAFRWFAWRRSVKIRWISDNRLFNALRHRHDAIRGSPLSKKQM